MGLIMGPFGVCIIVYSLQSSGPKGAHNFDQPPYGNQGIFLIKPFKGTFKEPYLLSPLRQGRGFGAFGFDVPGFLYSPHVRDKMNPKRASGSNAIQGFIVYGYRPPSSNGHLVLKAKGRQEKHGFPRCAFKETTTPNRKVLAKQPRALKLRASYVECTS